MPFTAADEVFKRISAQCAKSTPVMLKADTPEVFEISQFDIEHALAELEVQLAPQAQKIFLAEFVEKEFPHGFLPPSRVTKTLAAAAWMTQRTLKDSNYFEMAS